jgi:N4-gp56 family major capsid protein
MAIQTMDTAQARIGRLAGEIIRHAIPTEVLAKPINQMDMPKNKSDTLIVRSWVPYGGTVAQPNQFTVSAEAHITTEGVTPAADTIVPRDVTFTLNQYMALYALTDKDYDLYEDDIAAAMKEQTGERMGLVREMALYGKMKAATNKFYAGGGSTRASVNTFVTEALISKVVRTLQANHGTKITKILGTSGDYGTTFVEASYVCFTHTDQEYDIRRLAGFRDIAAYANRQVICEWELGTWQNIRFITSPELNPIINTGVAVASSVPPNGIKSTGGANIDVYPMIFMAKDAFAQVKLRGSAALDPIWLPPGQKDKNDPGGQRGYIGAKFYHACEILNQGWIAVAEVGVSAL